MRYWKCPSCQHLDEADPTLAPDVTPMHLCPALGNLPVPLLDVPAPDSDPKARNVLVLREDHAGASSPICAVRTDHADGRVDVTVYPDTAMASARGGDI